MPLEKRDVSKVKGDVLAVDASDSARTIDQNNYIEIKANPISKVGVFQYSGAAIGAENPNKIYNVYRPQEELESAECIESFKLIPFVDNHTMLGDSSDNLTPAEKKGVHGVLGEDVFFKDNKLFANLKIFSETIKDLLANGKKEVSAGYRCVYEKASGIFDGQNYDYIQRKIRGNHLALVDQGRMGSDVCVLDHMDHSIYTFDKKELFEMENENKKEDEKKTEDQSSVEERLAKLEAMIAKLVKTDKAVHEGKKAEDEDEEKKDDMKSEDEDEEKKEEAKKAEDEDPKEDKKSEDECEEKKKDGMDAAEIMRETVKMISKRDSLADALSCHIGTFDCAEMSLDEVAEYGAKKLGLDSISCGSNEAVVRGFLHSHPAPQQKSVFASDGVEKKSNFSSFKIN